jgi:rhodanese-related sulfurtransferase
VLEYVRPDDPIKSLVDRIGNAWAGEHVIDWLDRVGGAHAGVLRDEPRLVKVIRHPDVEQAIVAYCRGPYCVLSFEAVATLRSHGFTVRRFEDGFPEWKAAGLPIEAAS